MKDSDRVFREMFMGKDGNVTYGPEYVIDVPVLHPGVNGTYVELDDGWYRLKKKEDAGEGDRL